MLRNFCFVVLSLIVVIGAAQADVFNMGPGLTSLEMVTVGDPGNVGDTVLAIDAGTRQPDGTSGYGAVPYSYQIGKYEVTTGQYTAFLNAVAKTDHYGLYSTDMADNTWGCRIQRSGSSGSYTYTVAADWANRPVNYVSWGDEARFVNWLHNGQPTGEQTTGVTETGAYTLNGAITDTALMAVSRNAGAKYVIPSENEWYKAAYYKGGGTNAGYWTFPTQSDSTPSNVLSATGTNNANYVNPIYNYTDPIHYTTEVGAFAATPGPYGTFDMAGNVWESSEGILHDGTERGVRGGSYTNQFAPYDLYFMSCFRNYSLPSGEGRMGGFRVASSVPEPGSLLLLLCGAIAGLIWWRKR